MSDRRDITDLQPLADLVWTAAQRGMSVNSHDWTATLAVQRGYDVNTGQRRRLIAAANQADGFLNNLGR